MPTCASRLVDTCPWCDLCLVLPNSCATTYTLTKLFHKISFEGKSFEKNPWTPVAYLQKSSLEIYSSVCSCLKEQKEAISHSIFQGDYIHHINWVISAFSQEMSGRTRGVTASIEAAIAESAKQTEQAEHRQSTMQSEIVVAFF